MKKTLQASLGIFLFLALFSTKSNATIHVVTAQDFSFSPSNFSVAVGDTVRWTWVNGSHTTTSLTVPTGAATWNAPLNSTNTMFDYIVTMPGSYNYECTPHTGSMLGSFTASPVSAPQLTLTKKSIKAYPLPASEYLIIEGPADVTSYSIFDLTGKEVLKVDATGSVGPIIVPSKDFGKLEDGMYLIRSNGSGADVTYRITKSGKRHSHH